MPREYTSLSFEDYLGQGLDLDKGAILDAGTGFGVTTFEIAKRISLKESKARIISVDIDPQAFRRARKRLQPHGLLKLVTFVKADLSNMPQIATESVDLVVSTRTISDINSYPCRLTRAIAEFCRVLKAGGRIILSDELPRWKASSKGEAVAVTRWRIAKAISHLTGRPHANEVEPDDLEFVLSLVGFQECMWAVFEGEKIPQRRINYFVDKASSLTSEIDDRNLKNAFLNAIKAVKEVFEEKDGTFPPRYIIRATK